MLENRQGSKATRERVLIDQVEIDQLGEAGDVQVRDPPDDLLAVICVESFRTRAHDTQRPVDPLFPLMLECAHQQPAERRMDMGGGRGADNWRSEEHTSELQSLMRISYAVFCLKK